MYCKHCGSQIADDSVFCAKCGKIVVEASTTPHVETSVANGAWWATDNMQWNRPIFARGLQISILVILGLLSLYPLWCFISGGEAREYYGGMYGMERRHEIYVNDPWEIKVLKFTSVKMFNWPHKDAIVKSGYFNESDAKSVFRWRMFLILLPIASLIWLTIWWMKGTRFPGGKDIVPRDVADEIEPYDWDGFTKNKYVFYKKDGKYGIIDARNYCVKVPAQYDSIVWRMPNKLFDVTMGTDKQTLSISKTNPSNPNKKKIDSTKMYHRVVGIVFGLLGLFLTAVPIFSLLLPDDHSEPGGLILALFIGLISIMVASYLLKYDSDKKSVDEKSDRVAEEYPPQKLVEKPAAPPNLTSKNIHNPTQIEDNSVDKISNAAIKEELEKTGKSQVEKLCKLMELKDEGMISQRTYDHWSSMV